MTIILALLLLAWILSVKLTQQRIQLEAYNKLNNVEQNQSPFVWDFQSFQADIVEPFQPSWQKSDQGIVSRVNNPQLSLNFSGEVLNPHLHSQLIVKSTTAMSGLLTIQAKTELNSDDYYYLADIALSGSKQIIDLQQSWKNVNNIANSTRKFNWDKSANKISSLVLQFSSKNPVTIHSITLPYNKNIQIHSALNVNCDGKITNNNKVDMTTINVFDLNQWCWFPSEYLWLKQQIRQTYPESILKLNVVKLWQKATVHKINQTYTNNHLLNGLLYAFVLMGIVVVFWITQKNIIGIEQRAKHKAEQPWYQWLGNRLLLKGAKKAITPYHLMINYSLVLIPTIFILAIMMWIKFPNATTFKVLPLYFIWALFQQYILGYVLAQRVFYDRTQNRLLSSLLAATLFSLLHMPSVNLMLVTFVAGGFWAYAWLVFGRLIPLAISHSILALMYYSIISQQWLYSAKTFQWFWE